MVFGWLRKKKKEEVVLPVPKETLPSDLERFRTRSPEIRPEYPRIEKPLEIGLPEIGPEIRPEAKDKIELILQKLDTIDTRLKLIEERLRR